MAILDQYNPIINATTIVEWNTAFVVKSRDLGFEFCLYASIPNKGSSLDDAWIQGNYPVDWRKRYSEQGYANIDPTVMHCMASNLPLIWSPDIFTSVAQKTLYEDAKKHGLQAGLSLPAHGADNRVGMLSLVANTEPNTKFWNNVALKLPEITLFRDYIEQTSKQFIHTPVSSQVCSDKTLTPREIECLQWSAIGKTSKLIAILLHCSESNINFHLTNARKKLNVSSRAAAVTKAFQLGFIRP